MRATPSSNTGARGADSRGAHPRTSHVPSITGLRLSPYGAAATLVNLSASGVLAECTVRLKVESPVQVNFDGGFSPETAAGRVTRCEVAAMGRDGLIRYHVAIAFNEPIPLEVPPPPEPVEAAAPTAAAAPEPPPPAPVPVVRNRW